VKKIGIVASLFFAFLLIFGASNFLGTQGVQAAATSITLMAGADPAANYVSNTGTGGTGLVTVMVVDETGLTNRSVSVTNISRNKSLADDLVLTEDPNRTGTYIGTFDVDSVSNENLTLTTLGGNDGDTIRVVADAEVAQITVDGKAPVISDLSLPHGSITSSGVVEFSGKVIDARSNIAATSGLPSDGAIFIEVEIAASSGDFSDETANAIFTATDDADGFTFTLLKSLGEGVHRWRVKAVDVSGIMAQTDSDTSDECTPSGSSDGVDGANCQENDVEVDTIPPQILRATTGNSWNSKDGVVDKNVRNMIEVEFRALNTSNPDKLDVDLIQRQDFLVGDPGSVPIALVFPNLGPGVEGNNTGTGPLPDPGLPESPANTNDDDLRSVVFLELLNDQAPDGTPVVRVVNSIGDLAGKTTSSGSVTAEDGIGPQLTMEIIPDTDNPVTNDKVRIKVTADEASVTPGANALKSRRIEDTTNVIAEGATAPDPDLNDLNPTNVTGKFTSIVDGLEWEWELTFATVDNMGLYNVFLEVTDENGNTASIGVLNNNGGGLVGSPTADTVDRGHDGIQTFQVDLDNPTPTITPGTGDDGTENPNAFVTVDFTLEATEYGLAGPCTATGKPDSRCEGPTDTTLYFTLEPTLVVTDFDTHDSVALDVATFTLDDVDVSDQVTVVSDGSGTKMFYKGSGLSIGEHEVKVSIIDEASNKADTTGLLFDVNARSAIAISLIPGAPNLISLPGRPDNIDINAVIPPDVPVTAVFAFAPELPGQWLVAARSCASTCGDFQGNLQVIDGTRAIVIITETSQPLSVLVQRFSGGAGARGALPTPPPILQLVQGFNLVPVIDTVGGRDTIDATEYFAGATDDIRKVYEFRTGEERFSVIPHTEDVLSAGPDGIVGTEDDVPPVTNVVTVGTSVWVFVDAAAGIILVP
jgi:hypothetical protein